jgi:hypothetical protein
MEKALYLVAYPSGGRPADLTSALTMQLGPALTDAGARGVQVNICDDDVSAAAGLRISMSPEQPDALIGVWIDSATDHLRRPFDELVAASTPGASISAYLVTESVPMVNTRFPAEPGDRTHGMAQVAFFRRPDGQRVDEWLDFWLNKHTQIAIDTQDTFAYVQNVVARVLIPGPTEWHAIVEECFPAGAMTDVHVFYDAVGDDERLARHQREMFASVQRFIDLSMIDTVPTSRYVLG